MNLDKHIKNLKVRLTQMRKRCHRIHKSFLAQKSMLRECETIKRELDTMLTELEGQRRTRKIT